MLEQKDIDIFNKIKNKPFHSKSYIKDKLNEKTTPEIDTYIDKIYTEIAIYLQQHQSINEITIKLKK